MAWSEPLVLLCGPPCTGKTAYCEAERGRHTRVSSEDDDKSAHYLKTKKLTKLLGKGEPVVVDDQNTSSRRRAMLLKGGANEAVLCVWCLPLGGRVQCEWANEWSMAELSEMAELRGTAGGTAGTIGDTRRYRAYRPISFLADCAARAYATTAHATDQSYCRHRSLEASDTSHAKSHAHLHAKPHAHFPNVSRSHSSHSAAQCLCVSPISSSRSGVEATAPCFRHLRRRPSSERALLGSLLSGCLCVRISTGVSTRRHWSLRPAHSSSGGRANRRRRAAKSSCLSPTVLPPSADGGRRIRRGG